MGFTRTFILNIVLLVISVFLFCEFLIYYVVLLQCSWPILDSGKADPSIPSDDKPVHAMFLADPHLLGPRRGHWFDKLRREWQMHRTFQTAMALHRPDVIFVLGDLFDEGLWCSDTEFLAYVNRFHYIFHTPEATAMYVVVGNHDIGFHYGISPYLRARFANAFNTEPVQLLTLRGVHFILVNSMAMEGDGCFLCRPAEIKLQKIARKLKCTKNPGLCDGGNELPQFSRPILLQHFPMYRESDEECHEPDEAPEDEKRHKFRERWECLSRESTENLFESLNPRLIVTGHTHHGCTKYHEQYDAHEFTIPSFSWRNKDNPSFMLALITPNNFATEKCYMPRESTVIFLYLLAAIGISLYAGISYRWLCRLCRRNRVFKVH